MLLLLLVAWLFAIEGRAVVVDQKIEPPEDSSALAERFGYDLTENDFNAKQKELHLLAVEEATDGIRRIYVNGEITDIVLVQPGEYDGGGKAKVMYEEISTTGWVTQYVDEDDSGDCDFVLVWQPVIISDGPFYEVCFSLKDVQECPEGGAL